MIIWFPVDSVNNQVKARENTISSATICWPKLFEINCYIETFSYVKIVIFISFASVIIYLELDS